MADVLLIFVREDLAPATALAEQCEKAGFSIFTGSPLEAKSEDYRAAIVIWSESAEFSLVFSESAARAVASGKALIASFADQEPPQSFDDAPTFDLYDWDGETNEPGFVSLFDALERSIRGPEPEPVPTEAVEPDALEAEAIEPELVLPELVLTVAVEPEATEARAVELDLATVPPELDQPEPDQPEQNLPELDPPDLEEPHLEEPKPPQLTLVEPEPPRLVLVEPEEFAEPALMESLETPTEPPALQLVASNEALQPEAALGVEAPTPEVELESQQVVEPVVEVAPTAMTDDENFSPPLTEAPPGERRTRGKKPQRARRAPAARPAAGPRAQPTRDVWRDVAQATFLAAVVFVTVMQVGHWTLGPATPPTVAETHAQPSSVVQLAGMQSAAAAEIAAPAAATPAPVAAAAAASVHPSPAPVRRVSARPPRSGFVQASYPLETSPDAVSEAPIVEEPAAPPGQRADLRRFRHGSKG